MIKMNFPPKPDLMSTEKEYIAICPHCIMNIPVNEYNVEMNCPRCKRPLKMAVQFNSKARADITKEKDPKNLNETQRQKIADDNHISLTEVNRSIDSIDMQRKNAKREKERKDKEKKDKN